MRENLISGGIRQGVASGVCADMGYQAQNACEARQSAKARLRQKVRSMRLEADRLEALANALPEVLPEAADAALWELLSR